MSDELPSAQHTMADLVREKIQNQEPPERIELAGTHDVRILGFGGALSQRTLSHGDGLPNLQAPVGSRLSGS